MQALSEKGTALLAKFKKFQKLSLVLYALAAMAFVFAGNILLTIIIVALDIFLEIKLYRCPHCGKGRFARNARNIFSADYKKYYKSLQSKL